MLYIKTYRPAVFSLSPKYPLSVLSFVYTEGAGHSKAALSLADLLVVVTAGVEGSLSGLAAVIYKVKIL